MKIILIIASVWCLSNSLQSDDILKQYFTPQEIIQLDSIRTFFNQKIHNACENSDDIEQCYQQYFDDLLSSPAPIDFKIPYSEQKKLYNTLDTDLKRSIWQPVRSMSSVLDSVITVRAIDYNMQDRYIDFLSDVSKEEYYFAQYMEPIRAAGGLAPSLTMGMARNRSGLDFNNERHQLILAIHFLTVNDQEANRPK